MWRRKGEGGGRRIERIRGVDKGWIDASCAGVDEVRHVVQHHCCHGGPDHCLMYVVKRAQKENGNHKK